MDVSMLSPVERDILHHLLTGGDDVPGNIAEATDRHPKSVSKRLPDLVDEGLIRNKGRGVYTLTPSGVSLARSLEDHRPGED